MTFNIPLPNAPAGSFMEGMKQTNELSKQMLENRMKQLQNQYYGSDIESQINNRNALTQGQNITNKYLPEKLQLGNENQKLVNKYYVPNIESEINSRNAQTGAIPSQNALREAQLQKINYMLQHPGLMGGSAAKDIQSLIDLGVINKDSLQQQNSPQNTMNNSNAINYSGQTGAPFNTQNPLVNAVLNKSYAQPAYQQQMNQAFNWVHTTPDAKNYEIAVGAGMGITPDAFVAERTKGKTIAQIAQDHGFDPNNLPEPDFLPTKGNITKLKSRQAALSEAKTLNKFVTEGLAPYSKQVNGRSFQQISDVLKGENKEQQKKFFAAYMLTPEVANIRQNLAQGNVGVTASQEIMNRSLMNIKPFTSLIDPEVFKGAQELADEKLSEAFGQAEKVYQVARSPKKSESNLKPVHDMTLDELKKERDKLRGKK